jgi:hypothetical protein
MRAILKRLGRLEERSGLAERPGTAAENEQTRYLRIRLQNSRLRCGLPPPSPERLAWLSHMTIPQILNSHRFAGSRDARAASHTNRSVNF